MDPDIQLFISDSDGFDDDPPTPAVSESSLPASQPRAPVQTPPPSRLRSVIHIPQLVHYSSSSSQETVPPNPSYSRGRGLPRRPRADTPSPGRLPSNQPSPQRSRRRQTLPTPHVAHATPAAHAARPRTAISADWTVAKLQRALRQLNVTFHRSDNKATLLQLYNTFIHATSPANPPTLPGSRRTTATHRPSTSDVTMRPRAAEPNPGTSVPTPRDQVVSYSAPTPPIPELHNLFNLFLSSLQQQDAQTPRAHASHHPIILPSLPSASAYWASLAPPSVPAPQEHNYAPTEARHGELSNRNLPTNLSLFPSLPLPHPLPLPHHPNVLHVSDNPATGLYPAYTVPPAGTVQPAATQFTLASASPPVCPPLALRPSPVSSTLRQQIIAGNYVDLAQLLKPPTGHPHPVMDPQGTSAPVQQKFHSAIRIKELNITEFTFAFSLFRDTICSVFPERRAELDDYMTIILDLALRFGGTGFYSYHVIFASQAAGRIQQFNQSTYWGTMDSELYCRIFATRSLPCDSCGAPSHPGTACTLTTPLPRPLTPSSTIHPLFPRPSPAAPPPPIAPTLSNNPANQGCDKKGRPILFQGRRMVCNNFNDLGCISSSCRFLHTCSSCGGAHAKPICTHNPTRTDP